MGKALVIRFASEDTLTSRVIKFFSHGEWSHVDVVTPSLLGGKRLVGARLQGGVRSRPWNYINFKKTKLVQVPVTEEAYIKAMKFLYAQIGKPYDWTAIAAFAFDRNWEEDDSWFCSELVAAVLQKADAIPQRLADGVNKITPSDLALMLSSMGYWN